MATVSAGQSVQLQIGAFEGLWVNCSGVGFIDFECKSRGTIQLTSQYQRIGYYGDSVCVELRCVSGVIDYSTTPVAIEPLTAKQAGDGSDSSPLDLKLTVNQLIQDVSKSPSGSGILCAAIGDSRLANSFQNADVSGWARNYRSNQGAITWLSFLTNQRINLPYNYDLAVSGTGTAAIRASIAGVLLLSPRPSVCIINGGTNDFAVESTLARAQSSFANIQAAALELASNGILPIIEVDTPRATSSWSANAGVISAAYNQMLRDWCRSSGVLLVDYESQYIQNDGEPVAAYNVADGIHQSCTGGAIRALKYADVMSSFLPKYEGNSLSVRDAFSSTLNPKGNLISSISLMTGTGGTNTGTGASGTVAAGWTNRVISGTMTAVASKESPRNDGILGDRQVITLTATTASEHRFSPSNNPVTTGNYPAGTQAYAELDVEITALSGVVDYIRLVLSDFDGTTEGSRSYDMKDVFATGLNPLPLVPLATNTGVGNFATTLKGTMRTELITIGQTFTSTQLIFRLETKMAAGASVTIKVGHATIKAV